MLKCNKKNTRLYNHTATNLVKLERAILIRTANIAMA